MFRLGTFLAVLLIAISGCSRVAIEQPADAAHDNAADAFPTRHANAAEAVPTRRDTAEEFLARQIAEERRPDLAAFQPCLLATDCLALDKRPFRACLTGAERCPQDAEMYRVPLGGQR